MAKPTIFNQNQNAKSDFKFDLEDPNIRALLRQELGMKEEPKKVGIFQRLTGVLDAFRPTDDVLQAQKKGVLSGVADYFLDIPKAVGSLVTGRDYRNEFDEKGGSDILKQAGIKNKLVRGAGGFVLDTILDPTTYVTIGTGAGAKVIVGGSAKTLTKSGAKALARSRGKFMQELGELGTKELGQKLATEGITNAANKSIPELAEELAIKRLSKFSDEGAKVFKELGENEADDLAQELIEKGTFDQGGFKFAGRKLFDLTPQKEKLLGVYVDPISSGYGALKKIPKVGEGLSAAEQGLGKFFGAAGSTFAKLVSPKAEFTGGNEKFAPLYEATRQIQDYLTGTTDDIRRKYKGVYEQINAATDKPEALVHLIEGMPEDLLQKLPDDLKQSIESVTMQMSDEAIQKARKEAAEAMDKAATKTLDVGDLGEFSDIIDQAGVKKNVFKNTFTPAQTEFLKQQNINTADDLLAFLKDPKTKIPENIPYTTRKQIEEKISRAQAGKFEEAKKVKSQLTALDNDPRIREMLDEYKGLENEAKEAYESVEEVAKFYGKEDLIKRYSKYTEVKERLLDQQKKVLDRLVDDSKKVRVESVELLTQGDTPYQRLMNQLGLSPAEGKKLEERVAKAVKESSQLDKKIRVRLDQVRQIVDPKLRGLVDDLVKSRIENTDLLLRVGAILGESIANYVGRIVTKTPSGKDLTKKAGNIFGGISKSAKQMLDPRSAVTQKKRIYDYLGDLIAAGGETTLSGARGKEAAAKLVEQLAKDDLKVEMAKQFDGFAKRLLAGEITDPAGGKLYSTLNDIFDNIELPASYQKHINTFRETGQLPEILRDKLEQLGYKQIKSGGQVVPALKGAWFDEETYEVMTKMHKKFFGDEATNDLVKLYDKVHNIVKKSQTVWFPAFHVRNAFSNIAALALAGTTNPKRFSDAVSVQQYIKAVEKGNKSTMSKLGNKTLVNGFKVSDIYAMAKNNGVVGDSFFNDLSEELVGAGTTKLSKLNPLSDEFIPTKIGTTLGQGTEQNARLALFIDRLSKGDDIRSAALKVKEVLFDYGELTDFEKNIMKRFVPYYTWTRKNAELHLRTMLTQPGRYNTMIRSFKAIKDAFDLSEEEENALPDWAKDGFGVLKGGGGKVTAITQFGLPYEGFAQTLSGNPLNQLGLFPKTAIELGTGKSIFKNKAILDDTDGKAFRKYPQFIKDRMGYREEQRVNKDGEKYTVYTVDPWAKYWVGTLLGRTASTASKASTLGAEGDPGADVLNLFTGLKKYDFDITEEKEKRNREQAKEMYGELVRQGVAREYTQTYIPKEKKEEILKQMGK